MGHKSTKVANAYSEPIWVKVAADRMYVNAVKVSVEAKDVTVGMEMNVDWDKVSTDGGYTRIGPERVLQFDVEIAPGKEVAYITIFSEESKLLICNCFPRREGKPVVVDSEGFLRTVDNLDEAVSFDKEFGTEEEEGILDVEKLKLGPKLDVKAKDEEDD